jgi:uncharacterized RmlC-like cupin family protein
MCAMRAIPVPPLPKHIDTGVHAPQMAGLSAVAVLPCDTVPTKHLAVTVLRTEPGAETMPHHHGELDTMLYVARGTMAFHCGADMRADVSVRAGELCFIEPHAVHAEHNPDPVEYSLGITARDTPGAFLFPCDAPGETKDGRTGIVVAPPAAAPVDTRPDNGDAPGLAPLSAHHVRARRVALDRLSVSPGGSFVPAGAAEGETALTVLKGKARLRDQAGSAALEGAQGAWWYIEPGTRWSLENVDRGVLAEVLLIRSAGRPLD